MKSAAFHLIALLALLLLVIPAAADQARENPSIYSCAEIVHKLPELWDANPAEVTEMMRNYPDLTCYRNYDIIGCVSVNNKYSSEVHVNYQFTSAEDDAAFVRATFSMNIDSSEEVQKLLEAFWLDGMAPIRMFDAYFPSDQIILYFSTENTLMTVTVPMDADGKLWLAMVDFGVIRG